MAVNNFTGASYALPIYQNHMLYEAVNAGTGYSIGDVLIHQITVNPNVSPATYGSVWINRNTGAVLTTDPLNADISLLPTELEVQTIEDFFYFTGANGNPLLNQYAQNIPIGARLKRVMFISPITGNSSEHWYEDKSGKLPNAPNGLDVIYAGDNYYYGGEGVDLASPLVVPNTAWLSPTLPQAFGQDIIPSYAVIEIKPSEPLMQAKELFPVDGRIRHILERLVYMTNEASPTLTPNAFTRNGSIELADGNIIILKGLQEIITSKYMSVIDANDAAYINGLLGSTYTESDLNPTIVIKYYLGNND